VPADVRSVVDVDTAPAKANCGWFLVRHWCEKSKRYIPMQVAMTLRNVRRWEEAVYPYPFSHGFGSWMVGAPTRKEDGVTIPALRIAGLCIEQVRRLYKEEGSQMPAQQHKGGGGTCVFCAKHTSQDRLVVPE
jgi:hypothetical protein